MSEPTVKRTRDLGFCVSCEACSAACPNKAILTEYRFGQFLPVIDRSRCRACGFCLKVCPGIGLDYGPAAAAYIASYTGYALDAQARLNSASGGIISVLASQLLKSGSYNCVFLLDFDAPCNTPARLSQVTNPEAVSGYAKSKYIPASVYNVIRYLKEHPGQKTAVVGTPCQFQGIRKFLKEQGYGRDNILFLGLFCERTMNYNLIRYFKDKFAKGDCLSKFEFKSKQGCGWPGDTLLTLDGGRELFVYNSLRIRLKKYFQLKRCLYCADKLNEQADISCGDCYLPQEDCALGKSSIIVRTEKGRRIMENYAGFFNLKACSLEEIMQSQALGKNEAVLTKGVLKLKKSEKFIRWGMRYNVSRIEFDLFCDAVCGRVKGWFSNSGRALEYAGTVFDLLKAYLWRKIFPLKKASGIAIGVIASGISANAGAEAMALVTQKRLKEIFPDRPIYFLVPVDYESAKNSGLNALCYGIGEKKRILRSLQAQSQDGISEIISKIGIFIDIRGFYLSSQLPFAANLEYLMDIAISLKYRAPYYILPQSLGPFDYRLSFKLVLWPLMKLYLKYPRLIFSREKEGAECLLPFSRINIRRQYDIVLRDRQELSAGSHADITGSSVALIPSVRIIRYLGKREAYRIYRDIAQRITQAGKQVYLLCYAAEDARLCADIRDYYASGKVRAMPMPLGSSELKGLAKKFDFTVSSRYHGIVHAYTSAVPVVALGWAVKYRRLLEDFAQSAYYFDCRQGLSGEAVIAGIERMFSMFKTEKSVIQEKYRNLESEEDVFETVRKMEAYG